MHSGSDIDWNRLEDLLQSNENLRAGNRAESDRSVASPEPQFDESDPWAWGYEPWPAPRSVKLPDASGNSLRSQTSISDVANQIFGVK